MAYIVRAVTPGSFVHPAATVEDMYRPSRYARTSAGRLDIDALVGAIAHSAIAPYGFSPHPSVSLNACA